MNIPDYQQKIQAEEVDFRNAAGQGILRHAGGILNYVLGFVEPAAIGTYEVSTLNPMQFMLEKGSNWVLADGRTTVDGTVDGTPISQTPYGILKGRMSMPDGRGLFMRMLDNTGSFYPGETDANLGQQNDNTVLQHDHTGNSVSPPGGLNPLSSNASNDVSPGSDFGNSSYNEQGPDGGIEKTVFNFNPTQGVGEISSEARAKNITINIYIRIA